MTFIKTSQLLVSSSLFIFSTLFSNNAFSQTGPGGVGATDGTSKLTFWMKASEGTTTSDDGSGIIYLEQILDQSGLSHLMTAPDCSSISNDCRPRLTDNLINGWPAIQFTSWPTYLEGPESNDILGGGYRSTEHTIYHVVQNSSSQQGAGYISSFKYSQSGSYSSFAAMTFNITNNPVAGSYEYGYVGMAVLEDDGINETFYYYEDNNGGLLYDTDPVIAGGFFVPQTDSRLYISGDEKISTYTMGGMRQNFGSSDPTKITDSFTLGARTLGADPDKAFHAEVDLAETIIFNKEITEVERIIVENYLSSKYAITLSANDYYSYDGSGNHYYDVAGIGQTDSEQQTEAFSSLLGVSSSAISSDDTYFFFGHDNESITSWQKYDSESDNEVPEGNVATLPREWRVEHNLGNINLTLSWDVTEAPTETLYDSYFLLVDTDGDFLNSDDQEAYEMIVTGNIAEVTILASDLSNGDYLKLAIAAQPQAPETVTAVDYLHERSLISWEAVTKDVLNNDINLSEQNLNYTVYYNTVDDFANSTLGATTTNTSAYVSALSNRATYYFWVVANLIHPEISSAVSDVADAYTGVVISWEQTEIYQEELPPDSIPDLTIFLSDTLSASNISYDIEVEIGDGLNSMYSDTLITSGLNYSHYDELVSIDNASIQAIIRVDGVGSNGEIEQYSIVNGGTGYTYPGDSAINYNYDDGSNGTAVFKVRVQAPGSDFDFAPDQSLVIDGNVPFQTLSSADLGLVTDEYVEPDETFKLIIHNVFDEQGIYDPDTLSGGATLSYTIQDDDNPRKIYFDTLAVTASEPASGFTILKIPITSNSPDPINETKVSYIILDDGTTAVAEDDFVLPEEQNLTIETGSSVVPDTIFVTINYDSLYDNNETIVIQLVDPVNCNLGNDDSQGQYNQITVTIEDPNLPKVSFDDPGTSLEEDHYSDNGNAPLSIDLALDVPTRDGLEVSYVLSGDAQSEGLYKDYIIGAIEFPANSTSASLELTILEDLIYEGDQTAIITLQTSSDNNVGADSEFTLTIVDNDSAPEISFVGSFDSSNESEGKTFTITFEANRESEIAATIAYSITTNGADTDDFIDDLAGSFTFAPTIGAQEYTSTQSVLTILNDSEVEAPESIVLEFDAASMTHATPKADDTYTIMIFDDELGPNGPGGVGSSSNNALWLRADRGVFADSGTESTSNGDDVKQWRDQSGNSNNFVVPSSDPLSYQDSNSSPNGQPLVSFDASDPIGMTGKNSDALIGNNTNFITSFIVFVSTQEDQSHLFSIKDNDGETTSSLFAMGLNKDGNNGLDQGAISFETNGTADLLSHKAYFENNTQGTILYTTTLGEDMRSMLIDGVAVSSSEAGVVAETGNTSPATLGFLNSTDASYFDGELAEVIIFNTTLNDLQRVIIENYLSEKYNIAIPNDYYSNSAYNHDVTGIGKNSSDFHDRAIGGGVVLIENPSDLDEDEYLFWGENGGEGGTTIIDDPNINANFNNIWNRRWYVDYTDAIGANNDEIGTVDISVNYETAGISQANPDHVYLIVSSDPDFQEGSSSTIYPMSSVDQDNAYFIFQGVELKDGDYFTLGSTDEETSLPVELLKFTAELTSDGVLLNWTTSSELNNSHFEIERSADGEVWTKIHKENGNGTINSISNYSFIDVSYQLGQNYYRLSQTDYDGTEEILGVRIVHESLQKNTIVVYPNPMEGDLFNINWTGEIPIDKSQILLRDLQGSLINYEILTGDGQSISVKVNAPKGFYILQVGNGIFTKLIKKD